MLALLRREPGNGRTIETITKGMTMNASELKRKVESAGREPYFFTRSSMKFFGDTMRNYGAREKIIKTYDCPAAPGDAWRERQRVF